VDSVGATIYTLFDNNFRSTFFLNELKTGKLTKEDLSIVHGLYFFDNFVI